ncbi:hypothetical protein HPB52_005052 [Rhipicephalus sanguineus]|uniref:THAP-type domain-containing protein n=1 Tax=Rhipicephalus sanguineus TaxID=34632 RepID=A0A9D4QJE2_RHISA|nr:hypothetical protein HPB52_005052 [Rhipicephalus sanguineus]
MPQYCAAYGCCNTFGLDEVDFHKFPRDQKVAAKWVTGVKRKDFKLTRASVLCSKHFHDSDYVLSPSLMQSLGLTIKSMRVNSDAVPSVFPHLKGPSPRTYQSMFPTRVKVTGWDTLSFAASSALAASSLVALTVATGSNILHDTVDDVTELRPITGGGETRNAARGACCSFSAKSIEIRRVAEFASCPAMPRGSAVSTMLRSGSVTHASVLGVFSIWYFGVLSIKCSARPSVFVSELRSPRNRDAQLLQYRWTKSSRVQGPSNGGA